jgi:predicted Zn-dependent peptidase
MNKSKYLTGFWILISFLFVSWSGRQGDNLDVPVDYYKLDNGLKVVLSPDKTAPTIAVGVYYNIGFRIEPKDRTGLHTYLSI